MEDLWKDITLSTLSSLHHPSVATQTITPEPQHNLNLHIQPNRTSNMFQDFLARPSPLGIHTHTQTIPIVSTTAIINNNSPPLTILSLNNTDHPPDFHLGDSSSGHSPPYNPFDCTCSSAHHHKRYPLDTECDEMNNLGNAQHPFDRRHKRMIMNRESAARSRARKRAYTTELELQVAQLKRENAGLKMEQEVHMRNQAAAASASSLNQSPKKHKLHRTSTAPF